MSMSKTTTKAPKANPLSQIVAPKLLKRLQQHGSTKSNRAAKDLEENLEGFLITDLPTKGRGMTQNRFLEAVQEVFEAWAAKLESRPKSAGRAVKALSVAVDRLALQMELAAK